MAVRLYGAAWVLIAFAACNADIGDPAVTDGGATASDAPIATPDAVPLPDAAPPADAQPCVEGDARITDPLSGVCYIYFEPPVEWSAARDACLAINAHLVVSTTQAENDAFTPLAGQLDVWLGGNDINAEGQWLWISGESMLYTNWRTGEPNNAGMDQLGEDCMILEGDNGGLWDDRGCANTYGYICER
jgi:hypothetical protein